MAGWLTRSCADVPPGDDWLGPRERAVLATLRVPKRRADWRLGRWTAKAALAAWLGADSSRIEVLAGADGAPEAWLDGERAPVSISLSHRAGRALAVVDTSPSVVGCDLEWIEPRSDAFVREWLAPSEQAEVAASGSKLLPNLFWTAKEAAAKVRHEGLRLDVRSAVARLGPWPGPSWQPVTVDWTREGLVTRGWWRLQDGYILTVAAAPDGPPPQLLR